ncbi:hypothetical protein OAO01_08035 [Oligoflexia bacterium]|nr:hypothetical protein [Oligoflexia bacterium]
MDTDLYTKQDFNTYLAVGAAISVAIHCLLFISLSHQPTTTLAPPPMVVDIVMEQPNAALQSAKKNLIVTPPDRNSASAVAPNTNLLSDKDFAAEKEQLRRGAGADAGPVLGRAGATTSQPAQKHVAPAPQQELQQAPPKEEIKPEPPSQKEPSRKETTPKRGLKHLALDKKTLLKKFGDAPPKPPHKKTTQSGKQNLTPTYGAVAKPFSRPSGSGARFLGAQGTADYLPHLPDGDITLLNAKANQFAVFVRRVATQVFSQLRLVGWSALKAQDIVGISDFSTVRAVLSVKGELLRVVLEGPSGSQRFDGVVLEAAKSGAKDPHPPPAAVASDGNIHFIFQAKSWTRIAPSGRHGAISERRWLLLATGLE